MSLRETLDAQPAVRYCAPLGFFLLLTSLQDQFSGKSLFLFYCVKIGITIIVFLYLFSDQRVFHSRLKAADRFKEISGSVGLTSILYGAAAFRVWILLGALFNTEHVASFDPDVLDAGFYRVSGIAIRILGASIVVPLVEEIFWRGYLMRYLIKDDFLSVPIGTFTKKSFILTLICFVLVHRVFEWPGAIAVGAIYGYYVVKTGSLRGVIVAHGVTNLLLGIYVLQTGQFWWW